jgi:hypothetical protein
MIDINKYITKGDYIMQPPKILSDLMRPITARNEMLAAETPEERTKRIQAQFNLYHGKGIRKKKRKKKKG